MDIMSDIEIISTHLQKMLEPENAIRQASE